MLVLQRQLNEIIDIQLPDGRVITVQIVAFKKTLRSGQQAVRIGFTAPLDITIHRREITDRIEAIREELDDDNDQQPR